MPLLSGGMMAVLVAQFLSALADNAILIVAIALVTAQGWENLIPMLQGSFVLPYILLAPYVGYLADKLPKGQAMLLGNVLKFFGALGMTLGLNPISAYCIIGMGAAVYSPAKYGILTQMFGADKLVKANGMMEASTIAAILLGVLVGGLLADKSMDLALWVILAAYGLAAMVNLLIPRLPPEKAEQGFHFWQLTLNFGHNFKALFANPDARFSLLGTSMFWGCGITLRLILFAWVPAVLLIQDNQTPANLMAVLSVGIVVGAALAGMFITLKTVNRTLIGGLLIGPAILLLGFVTDVTTAMVCLAATGLFSGVFVVPLNALLQEYGHHTVGAGNALAVQNFCENLAMLLFVGGYGLIKSSVAVNSTVIGFGVLMLLFVLVLAVGRLNYVKKPG